MFNSNVIKERVLVLSKDKSLLDNIEKLLVKSGYLIDKTTNRKNALTEFLKLRHSIILVDEVFLPRFSYRLTMLFKAAHRMPGLIVLRKSESPKNSWIFILDAIAKEINVPCSDEELLSTIKYVSRFMRERSQSIFYKNLLLYMALAVPLIILLAVLLSQRI